MMIALVLHYTSCNQLLFALLWSKGLIFIGERENTKPFPLSSAPYPLQGPHLPLFPTSARSLLITHCFIKNLYVSAIAYSLFQARSIGN
ncbi:hypothetical protein NIES25_24720 [Nostoc linckia NIES-25]|nr:hypothetical protein NIES25_24720 [Nostoc linckia NIES-25]